MTPPLSDEHIALLEAALANVENDYRPTCESINYGSGCPGPTDASLDFWRRAVDALPALLAEVRHHRSRELSAEDVEALRHVADELREQIEHWQMLAKTNGWGFSPGQKSRALAALHRLCGSKP